MLKPRMILADTNLSFLTHLMQEFLKEYFEKVELEVITDRAYFEELFSKPQQAALLVVSENLYDSSLLRHNIGRTFVLTETNRGEESEGDRAFAVYKYTSPREVYLEIIGKSGNALVGSGAARSGSQLVVVTSAAGGVGKTTLAMGLCAALTKSYKKALYINADRLQSFQYLLENPSPLNISGLYAKLGASDAKAAYSLVRSGIRNQGFAYLPPFKSALMSLGMPYGIFQKLALGAKESGEYDFVVVDADSCFDEDKALLMSKADKVVLVTDQSTASVVATNTLVSNVGGLSGEKYLFVCNKLQKDQPNALEAAHIPLRFTVSETVDQTSLCAQLGFQALAKENSLQRLAFLII